MRGNIIMSVYSVISLMLICFVGVRFMAVHEQERLHVSAVTILPISRLSASNSRRTRFENTLQSLSLKFLLSLTNETKRSLFEWYNSSKHSGKYNYQLPFRPQHFVVKTPSVYVLASGAEATFHTHIRSRTLCYVMLWRSVPLPRVTAAQLLLCVSSLPPVQ
jgi:hypothetical protein